VYFYWEPTVRSSYEKTLLGHPSAFKYELALIFDIADVLDNRRAMDIVERTRRKRKVESVSADEPDAVERSLQERRIVDT
jgi:hypothetical protein